MQTDHERNNDTASKVYRNSDFFRSLSAPAMADLESLLIPISHPANKVLFSETQAPDGVRVVIDGEVKLSINSTEGRRLSLRIARSGEVLGLSSTLSAKPYEMTADTLYPAKIAHISRTDFLHFLARHPDAYESVTCEVSRSYNLACEQLRLVGLSTSVPERLASLLLRWSESGTRCRVALTHEEIGEFIGASRETVTRTLSIFKNRRLVAQHGCTIEIPCRDALENYARG
jgi:CRP/FNR family transcriptional regulator, cyclic AMP receptor protein